jgi:hypothetical protein
MIVFKMLICGATKQTKPKKKKATGYIDQANQNKKIIILFK